MRQLVLQVAAEIRERQLVVHYAVQNNGERDVYLLNRLHRASPPEMSPDIAYVELDPNNGLVEVSKRIPDAPATGGSGPPVPVAPYVTPVRVGETFDEAIHLALPVRIYREYGRSPIPDPDRDRVIEYQGVRLVLGYYWRDPGVTETEGVALGQAVIIPGNFPHFPELLQIATQVVPLVIPVVEPGA
jgi:hypothetical protein